MGQVCLDRPWADGKHGGSEKHREHVQAGDHDIARGNEIDDEEHYETSDACA
jgi:hypothetical protein